MFPAQLVDGLVDLVPVARVHGLGSAPLVRGARRRSLQRTVSSLQPMAHPPWTLAGACDDDI